LFSEGAFQRSRVSCLLHSARCSRGDHDARPRYKIVELAGSSEKSIEDAINIAISRASKTLRNLRWFEILQTRGHIDQGRVREYQVVLKVGFTMDEA
jgi:flavin-binding protein dodecin